MRAFVYVFGTLFVLSVVAFAISAVSSRPEMETQRQHDERSLVHARKTTEIDKRYKRIRKELLKEVDRRFPRTRKHGPNPEHDDEVARVLNEADAECQHEHEIEDQRRAAELAAD